MASLNKVILIGYMTADPELKQTQSGLPVCSFSIGVQRKFAKPGEQSQTDFINIVTWRQQAEFVSKYFKKGKPICIVGALQSRTWTDQQNQKRYTVEVVADEVSFVDKADGNAASNQPGNNYNQYSPDSYGAPPAYASPRDTSNSAPKFEELSNDDDLPF